MSDTLAPAKLVRYELRIALDEIERLRAEVEDWKDRYESERRDHEATMKHCDEELARLDWEADDGRGR